MSSGFLLFYHIYEIFVKIKIFCKFGVERSYKHIVFSCGNYMTVQLTQNFYVIADTVNPRRTDKYKRKRFIRYFGDNDFFGKTVDLLAVCIASYGNIHSTYVRLFALNIFRKNDKSGTSTENRHTVFNHIFNRLI